MLVTTHQRAIDKVKELRMKRSSLSCLGVLTTLACRGKTKRTWLECSGSNFGLYILLQCLYIYILDLQSKISVTIATSPARCRDERGNCYRTGGNISHLWVKDKSQVQLWNGSKAEIKRAVLWIAKKFSWWVSANESCTAWKREAVFRHKTLL